MRCSRWYLTMSFHPNNKNNSKKIKTSKSSTSTILTVRLSKTTIRSFTTVSRSSMIR